VLYEAQPLKPSMTTWSGPYTTPSVQQAANDAAASDMCVPPAPIATSAYHAAPRYVYSADASIDPYDLSFSQPLAFEHTNWMNQHPLPPVTSHSLPIDMDDDMPPLER
jgi:hypothetical protein